jgi:cytochrome c oxidase assembly protein Cox11
MLTSSLNWEFYSKSNVVSIPIGQEKTIFYFAKNNSSEPVEALQLLMLLLLRQANIL